MNIADLLTALPPSIAQGLLWGIMAIGVYTTFKILNFADLSVDGSLALGGAVAVVAMTSGVNPIIALIYATLAGLAAGFVTGILHTAFGIPDILAGILTQIALYSINLNIMGRSNMAVSIEKYNLVVSLREVNQAIWIALVFVAIIIIVLYWFFGTELGMTIRSTGCNKSMSRAQGINTNISTVVVLAVSNGLVGLSGALIMQYQGNADVNMGRGAIVIGLAAVIIGGVLGDALLGKHMNFALRLIFAALGAVIYYIVITFVVWLGLPSENMKLFSAIVVAIFLAVPYLRERHKSSFARLLKRGA